jgi:hypothetical protein
VAFDAHGNTVVDVRAAAFTPGDHMVDVKDLGEIFVALIADVMLPAGDLNALMIAEKTPRITARPVRNHGWLFLLSINVKEAWTGRCKSAVWSALPEMTQTRP